MYRKYNNIVFVFISVSGINNTWACENKLPSDFRPPVSAYIPLSVRQSNACAMAWIGTDGLIQIYNYGGSTGNDFLSNYISYTID